MTPDAVTLVGLGVGLAAIGAVAGGALAVGLGLFLLNRLVDGLDGALARAHGGSSAWGGMLDLVADVIVYVGIPIALAIDDDARWPAAAVVCAGIAVNLVTVLTAAAASTAERSVALAPGLVEGTETIVAYVVLLAVPVAAGPGLWVFAAAVWLTALIRLVRTRPGRSAGPARPPGP